MGERKFYDLHCHAMNLSHPSLLAFVKKLDIHTILFWNSVPFISWLFSSLIQAKLNRVMNLLSVMERDLGEFFLLMEGDLQPFLTSGKVVIGGNPYDKIVLTPLMMDFGYKGVSCYPDIHYNKLPPKPIAEQVVDLFTGIRKYVQQSSLKLFEIYPFLGINTQNYQMVEPPGTTSLPDLLDKYFGPYRAETASQRPQLLLENMGNFTGNIDTLGGYAFAGVKVYPPLGFDPWPAAADELAKVRYLYDCCVKKQIPLTAHCSDGGYQVHPEGDALTSPGKWATVLKHYPALKLNLAHFGKQGKAYGIFPRTAWRRAVVDLIAQHDQVYADFSCSGLGEAFYGTLRKVIEEQPDGVRKRLNDRILFGTDFMINLLWIDSYREYLDIFSRQTFFTDPQKNQFSSVNPERFLFQ